jgi:hypothetical protein
VGMNESVGRADGYGGLIETAASFSSLTPCQIECLVTEHK